MACIPETVRRQLKQSSPAGPHPDENLLAAFAEGALAESLRTPVLKHLFACTACRGVVAVARPEVASAAQPAFAAAPFWTRWAPWRWAVAVPAVAALVGIAWIGQMELRTIFPAARIDVATAGTGNAPQLALQRPVIRGEQSPGKADLALQHPANFLASASKPAAVASLGQSRPLTAAKSRPAVEPRANSPAVEEPDTDMINTGFAVSGSREVVFGASPGGSLGQSWLAPLSPEDVSAAVAANSGAGGALPAHAEWMVSPSGALYESFDHGARWQSVAVRENLALRAVSSSGDDVWVGGNGGMLFHSGDAGRHWTRVVPVCNGLALAEDIVRVEFTDGNYGSIITATGKTWVTADQGETWEMR